MRKAQFWSACALTAACGTWHGPGGPPSPGGDAGGGGGIGVGDATIGGGDAATLEGGIVTEAGLGSLPDASVPSTDAGTGISALDAGTLGGTDAGTRF